MPRIKGTDRVRSERSDKGQIRATKRDVLGMMWTVEMHGMPLDLLERLFRASTQVTRNVVNRWHRAGWVRKAYYGGPMWVYATDEGNAMYGQRSTYKFKEPSIARIGHHRACIEARMGLEKRYADRFPIWISERQIRHDTFASYEHKPAVSAHLADGELEMDTGGGRARIAIEVELTPKSPVRVKEIMAELKAPQSKAGRRYEAVLYVVDRRARSVVENGLTLLAQEHPNLATGIQILDLEEVTK